LANSALEARADYQAGETQHDHRDIRNSLRAAMKVTARHFPRTICLPLFAIWERIARAAIKEPRVSS